MPGHATNLIDSFRHKGLRKKLIDSISDKGIRDKSVLGAMLKVPRHFFFDTSFVEFAYQDKPFPIGAGQTISQPYTVAFQTELLRIDKGMKVLEVGTGSGYQACILAEMGARVFSIERQKLLFNNSKNLISQAGYFVKTFYGDGYKGLPAYAPFDRIIVTAGAPYIPDALIEQLGPGGILVIPVGDEIQEMITIEKTISLDVIRRSHGSFRFVPLLQDKAKD